MREAYHGQSFIDQIATFIHLLEDIEQEYWWWFRSRHGKLPTQECDMLINHVELDFFDLDRLIFKFLESSDLPHNIRAKCIKAYIEVFNI